MDAREKKNRNVGLITSAGVHAVVLILLFFVMAWRAPDPPLPEYGIELNFGLDDQGTGEVQPEQPVGDTGESTVSESAQETTPEETTEAPDVSKEVAAEKAEEPVVSKVESPVTVKDVKKPAVTTKESVKPESSQPKKEPTVNPNAESPKESTATEAPKKGEAASHGDDKAKTGDKGSEEGKLDAKALYGTPGGGGGGTGLSLGGMTGWDWADEPAIPQLPDNESGKIVFEIECDESGEFTRITTIERTLSPRAEQLLKDVIRKNSLVRTSGGKAAPKSTGTIVFVLRTK